MTERDGRLVKDALRRGGIFEKEYLRAMSDRDRLMAMSDSDAIMEIAQNLMCGLGLRPAGGK